MNADRTMTRFFTILGAVLGVLAAIASLALRSWWPLAALGLVLLGVTVLSLSETALFAPLLGLVLRAGERDKTRDKTTRSQTSEPAAKPHADADPATRAAPPDKSQ